jgi:hypothetical protein
MTLQVISRILANVTGEAKTMYYNKKNTKIM